MRKCAFLLISIFLLLFNGCGRKKPKFTEEEMTSIPLAQRTGLPEASGGFALRVADETITCDEIIAPTLEYLRPIAQKNRFRDFEVEAKPILNQLLTNKIANILLLQEAKKKAGDNLDNALDKLAEAEARKFITQFKGDTAKAEQALKEMGMDWTSFKDYHKKMMLSQSYIQSQLPDDGPITYSELRTRYDETKDTLFVTAKPTIQFSLIDIQPEKLQLTDLTADRRAEAIKLAGDLAKQISEGKDFAKLAKKYSHGHRSRFGGLWKPLQPDSLAQPYDILAAQAEKLKPGQFAGPIETDNHIFIMRLEEKRSGSTESFEDVQDQLEAQILLERRRKAVDKLSAKLAEQAAVGQKDVFIDFCVQKIYRTNQL